MNTEQDDRLDEPLFVHDKELRALEEMLYGHVIDAIDFDALARFEMQAIGLIEDRGIAQELAIDLGGALLQRAIERASRDPARYCTMGPPFGITEAERRAVELDPECPFCVEESKRKPDEDEHAHEDEPCPLCDELARSWREEHREALAKAGLVRGGSPS